MESLEFNILIEDSGMNGKMEVMECWNIGKMEYWNDGVMEW